MTRCSTRKHRLLAAATAAGVLLSFTPAATALPSAARKPSTELQSRRSDGTQVTGDSTRPSVTPDGKRVAFSAQADELLSDNSKEKVTNCRVAVCWQVYVHTRQSRRYGQTSLVSVAPDGRTPGDRDSRGTALDATGRIVAFDSDSSNLLESGLGWEIKECSAFHGRPCNVVYVRNLRTGMTAPVSVANGSKTVDYDSGTYFQLGKQPVHVEADFSMSADGRFVAFSSEGEHLAGLETTCGTADNCTQVYVRDLQTQTTIPISVTTGSPAQMGNGSSFLPSISPDGGYVVFLSGAGNLTRDALDPKFRLYRFEIAAGKVAGRHVVTDMDGLYDAGAWFNYSKPAVSENGKYVAFTARDASTRTYQVWGVDVANGGPPQLVSVDTAGRPGNGLSAQPAISPGGGVVVFASNAANIVGGTGSVSQVVEHVTTPGRNRIVSVDNEGKPGTLSSDSPAVAMSPGTTFIAFSSRSRLDPKQKLNSYYNVFLRTIPGTSATQ